MPRPLAPIPQTAPRQPLPFATPHPPSAPLAIFSPAPLRPVPVIPGEFVDPPSPPIPNRPTAPPPIDVPWTPVNSPPPQGSPLSSPRPPVPSPSPGGGGGGGVIGAGIGIGAGLAGGLGIGGAVGGYAGGAIGAGLGNAIVPGIGGAIGGAIGAAVGGAIGGAIEEGFNPSLAPPMGGGATFNFPPGGLDPTNNYKVIVTYSKCPFNREIDCRGSDVANFVRILTTGFVNQFAGCGNEPGDPISPEVISVTITPNYPPSANPRIPFDPPPNLGAPTPVADPHPFPRFPPPLTFPIPVFLPQPNPNYPPDSDPDQSPNLPPNPNPTPSPNLPPNPDPNPSPSPFPFPTPFIPPNPLPVNIPIPKLPPSPSPIPSPQVNPSPNLPPILPPVIPPVQTPPRPGDCCDCPPCPDGEKPFQVFTINLGTGDSGIFSLPPNSIYVSVSTNTVGAKVRSQSGNADGETVLFLGSYAFGIGSGFGDRHPISYKFSGFPVPSGVNTFTFALNFGSTATISVSYKVYEV